MRLGQTSVIHFVSEVVASVAGFVATLYIAQELGSEALGTFTLFVSVLLWIQAGVGEGVQQAVKKRISEHGGGTHELGAGVVVQASSFVLISFLIFVLAGPLNRYLEFEGASLLAVSLGCLFAYSFIRATLMGERKVHLAAVMRPLDQTIQTIVQLAVIAIGILGGGIVGLVWGYAIGLVVAALAGLVFIGLIPKWPQREHITRITGFARYSWLSGIEGRSLSSMDTVVLGVFVTHSLIGYYEVAWNLASILAVFGTSIADSLYPTLSRLSSQERDQTVSDLINDAIAYTGLFVIPGLAGAVAVGDRVLAIYDSEFTEATAVLVVLVLARLLYAYEAQLITVLNAIDRPQSAFRVNAVFVATNLGLNLLFVWQYGWTGAAVATTLASSLGLVLAYYTLVSVVTFEIPIRELVCQWFAAIVMGAAIYALEQFVDESIYATALLVLAGAALYFILLFRLSGRFRSTVLRNLPFQFPFL